MHLLLALNQPPQISEILASENGYLKSCGAIFTFNGKWLQDDHEVNCLFMAYKQKSPDKLCELLRLAVTVDMLDCTNLACVEHAIRRLVALELAVERNPWHPDYSGLGSLLSGATEEEGRLAVPKFSRAVADRQAQRAQILKQARLLREEKAADGKRRAGRKGGRGKGDPPAGGAES